MTANPREAIGGNLPPDALDDLLTKGAALLAQAARVPAALPDLDTAGRAVALVKMLRLAGQKIDDARKEAQKPHKAEADKIMDRARKPIAALEAAEIEIGKSVDVFRKVHGLAEIVSDFGPKAFARSVPGDITCDLSKLPLEYMTADEKKIKAALARGETIEGVTVGPPTETTVIS